MELPALLPKVLTYCGAAENSDILFSMLVKKPINLLVFFEYACDDETWSYQAADFMRHAITWFTKRSFEDRLETLFVQRIAYAIQKHFHNLDTFVIRDITCHVADHRFPINSLLFGSISPYLHDLILMECYNKQSQQLTLNQVTPFVFTQIEEFAHTGNVAQLWKHTQEEVLRVLLQATEWEITGLMELCQKILKRYINDANAIDMLLLTHSESWHELKSKCIDFLNEQQLGVHVTDRGKATLAIEFLDFRDEALDIFEKLHQQITHLAFRHTDDPAFTDIVSRCPKLIAIDVSGTKMFNERLMDMPETLEELDLSHCAWLSDNVLKKLLTKHARLGKIALGGNPQLTFMGWGELRKLKQLESLDVSQCLHITDEDLKLILQACHNVATLSLEECTKVSDRAFFELTQATPHLTELNVARCNVTDANLAEIATHCTKLVTLDITHCKTISEKGIIEVARHAPVLQLLLVSDLSETTLDKIHTIRPYLKVQKK